MTDRQPTSILKIGMAQMLVEAGRERANVDRAEEMIAQAAAAGCQFVVLPEVMDVGWDEAASCAGALPIPGPRTDAMAAMSRRHGLYVVSGLTERAGDKIHNAAVMIGPDGRLLHHHRKINIVSDVEGWYSIGDRLGVVHTPLGCVGMLICADSFMRANNHALARMGAQVILSPSAWAVPPDHDNARTPYGQEWMAAYGDITELYDLSIVGVSNVGQVTSGAWKGWKCIGCSLAMGPGRQVVAKGPYGHDAAQLIVVDVPIYEPPVQGTDWHDYLAKRGYSGA